MWRGEECHAEPLKLYSLYMDGPWGLFSKIAFKLLTKESNAPILANRRPGADIEA
jgi:hypothetical protein